MIVLGAIGRRAAALVPISALALGLAACGGTPDSEYVATHTIVGAADTTESRIVAEIYAAALSRTGVEVSTDLALGDRADAIRAVESGRVSVVPDHSGALIEFFQPGLPVVLTPAVGAPSVDGDPVAEQTYRLLASVLPEYLRVSDPALAEQQSALAMAAPLANKLGVSDIATLGRHCSTLTLGVEPGMLNQATVLRALAEKDGCTFGSVVQVASTEQAREKLAANEIQVAGTFVGAPGMAADGVTALRFPAGQLPAENVIPLFRQGSLGDPQIRALNTVAGELTTQELQEMVDAVDVGGRKIDDVVADWLAAHAV